MAASNVRHALFCAIVTIVISYPILGLNLEAEGINIVLTGTDATTIIAIACAALVVLLFQLFRDSVMAKLGVVNDLNPLTGPYGPHNQQLRRGQTGALAQSF